VLTEDLARYTIEVVSFSNVSELPRTKVEAYSRRTIWVALLPVICLILSGCGGPAAPKPQAGQDLGATIGSLAEVIAPSPIPVEGYGLVGGLSGTGSAECPPQIRDYLKQYILARLPAEHKVDVEQLINSRETSVVLVRGTMPPAVTKNQSFDVRVDALPDSQTNSLEGGWLYGAELRRSTPWRIGTRTLARAAGAVFIDTIEATAVDKRTGYVLGGGTVLDEYGTTLELHQPDYLLARQMSNILDARFGYGTAKAVSHGVIDLRIPHRYANHRDRFIAIVKATYIFETPALAERRIDSLLDALINSADKRASEIGLEAAGVKSLRGLATNHHKHD